MSLLIFRFGEPQSVLTFLKNNLKLLKDKAVEIIPKYGRTEVKVGFRVAKIFETLRLILVLYFKILAIFSVIRSGWF